MTFTETDIEESIITMNDPEWEQVIEQVLEKGYFVDASGKRQDLPPELLKKIYQLQEIEDEEKERN